VDFFDEHMPAWLQEHRISRPLSILLIYAVVILLLVGFFTIFVPVVSRQVRELVEASGQYTMQLLRFTKELNQPTLDEWLDRFYSFAPSWVEEVVENAIESNLQQITAFLTNALQNLISWIGTALQRAFLGTWNVVSSTVTFVIGIVIVPFWVFYILNDKAKVARAIYSIVPEKYRSDVHNLQSIVSEVLGKYVRGQLLLSFAVGTMSTVGLFALGVNFALLLGTVAGVFEVIPNIGPFLGAIPAVLIALLKSPTLALQVTILFVIIQQFENTFLVPKIMGASVQLHPTVVMIILVIGSEVAGIWGMILGVPLTAILRDVFYYLYLRLSEVEIPPEEALVIVHPIQDYHRKRWDWAQWQKRGAVAYRFAREKTQLAWSWMQRRRQELLAERSQNSNPEQSNPETTKSDIG
jgi:predicted PurR-regulated permease PerM